MVATGYDISRNNLLALREGKLLAVMEEERIDKEKGKCRTIQGKTVGHERKWKPEIIPLQLVSTLYTLTTHMITKSSTQHQP